MSETGQMTRAAGVVGLATLASRILGFVRDAVTAWFFGAGMAADAFFVAFRLPNLLRRLFAEGSLTVAFIPVFSELIETKGRKEAFAMAGATFRLLSLVLLVISALGVLAAPWVVRVIAPGFADDPEKLALTIRLTRITFPYIFFVALMALAMGILNTLRHFAAPALAPVMLNVAMIGSVFLLAPLFDPPVVGLAWGVILGGALQFLFQVPSMLKRGVVLWRGASLWHPALGRVGRLMGPTVLGAATYQINILVGTLLASLLAEGSVSYLYYADRLVQFPLGIFGIALATAALPTIARQAARGDDGGVGESFSYAVRLALFISVPATVGLIVLRVPIVALLFERGEFDPLATRQTAVALVYYALGLCSFSAVRIVVNVFYALQDTATPVRVSIISLAANMVLSLALMGPLAHGGLALATTLASTLNLLLLMINLKGRLGSLFGRDIMASLLKTAAGSAVMGGAVWLLAGWLPTGSGTLERLGVVAVCMTVGGVVYAGAALAFRSPELIDMANVVRKKVAPS
ncbi:MAG: murein biosynthesis integral membrane protein MurJ [Desulfatibacillaceae bacterium]